MNNDSNEPKPPVPAFTPVPVRPRHDGWTAERQIAFIEALAESGCIAYACRRVGKSETSAYDLRGKPRAASFRQAWDAALDIGSIPRIEEGAHRRARFGVPRPLYHRGELIGEYRHFDERLTMFLLRTRRPDRYGRAAERPPEPGEDGEPPEDPAITLSGHLDAIEFAPDFAGGEEDSAENSDGDPPRPDADDPA